MLPFFPFHAYLATFFSWLLVYMGKSSSFCLSAQAESALDQMDWIEKITGVIASLLSSQAPERVSY